MAVIVNLIVTYAPWIYAFCGIGVLLYLRAMLLARRERRRALFTLERESAAERAMRSFLMMMLFVFIAGAVYSVGVYIAPRLDQSTPSAIVESVPTPLLQPTPIGSFEPTTETLTPTETPIPRRDTPTATPSPLPSKIPTAVGTSPPPPPRCPNPGARILYPGVNVRLSGIVPIRGSAYAPNFQFYKVEFGIAPNPQQWSSISQIHHTQVSDSILDVWNTDLLPSGDYILRLTVVDETGNYPPENICTVPVKVVH
jgi:hypothetical protein